MPVPSASNYPSALDTDLTLLGDPADQQTFTLATSIGQGDTVFTVNEAITSVNIPCQLVWATGEICWATNKNDGTKQFTVERGASVPHTQGEGVRLALTALYIKQIKRAILAIEGALGVSPQGGSASVAARLSDLASRMAAREVLSVSHVHDGSGSGGSKIPPTSVTPQGEASGLDADLLDGQHGAYFAQNGRLVGANGGTKTIAGGVITCPASSGYSRFLVETEGGASTDDLDTISGLADGDILQLMLANAAHVVTLKHNTGNIMLPNSRDFVLKSDSSSMLRYDGTKLRITGGGIGKDYFLLKVYNFIVSGGYMSTADKQNYVTRVAGKSSAFATTFAGMIDGDIVTDVGSGVAGSSYPYITVDFSKQVTLDQYQIYQGDYRANHWWLYGSNSGDFAGEEEAIVEDLVDASNGATPVNITFAQPKTYRYWKLKCYRGEAGNWVGREFNFRFSSTFMIAGVPFGSKVCLYNGVTLKETVTQANTIYQYNMLMFTTPVAQFDTVKIYYPEDPSTIWMTFPVSASSGDVYTLYLK